MQYHICLYMPESGLFDLQVDNTTDLRSYEDGNRRRNKYAPYSTVRPAGIDLAASSTASVSSISSTSSHSSDNNQYHNQEPEPLVIIPYDHTESSGSSGVSGSSESFGSSESSGSSDTSDDEYSYDDSNSADSFDRESIEDHTEFCEYSDYDSVHEGGSIDGDDGIYEDELELDGEEDEEEEGYQDDDIDIDEKLDDDLENEEHEEHQAEEQYEHSFTINQTNPPEQQFASFTDTEQFGYRAASMITSNEHRQNYSQKRSVSLNSHLIQLTLQTAEQCCS